MYVLYAVVWHFPNTHVISKFSWGMHPDPFTQSVYITSFLYLPWAPTILSAALLSVSREHHACAISSYACAIYQPEICINEAKKQADLNKTVTLVMKASQVDYLIVYSVVSFCVFPNYIALFVDG